MSFLKLQDAWVDLDKISVLTDVDTWVNDESEVEYAFTIVIEGENFVYSSINKEEVFKVHSFIYDRVIKDNLLEPFKEEG